MREGSKFSGFLFQTPNFYYLEFFVSIYFQLQTFGHKYSDFLLD
jgi:hypothetical protein